MRYCGLLCERTTDALLLALAKSVDYHISMLGNFGEFSFFCDLGN